MIDKPYWNYRLVRHIDSDGEITIAIHEAHYDAGSDVPRNVSENPAVVMSETAFQLTDVLRKMRRALKEPILDYKDFEGQNNDDT